ncbi:hypothetical protein [Geosporobacter ferrireducens]|uniref:Uncharacterized protein n=1 Tax=Geosporobacter ferrireducens TaxID=1424294 RepID=A0A1D8GNP4_9FIRM|nr:hypothetical protein [Geosporobacter ferrireducens]AOT72538.1 hypothetical protein Gferi_25080 [Geosporobacter ferrireducens]
MDHLARSFLEEDTENRDLYINGILLKNQTSIESLNKKFNDYLFRINLCSYIKKSIAFAAIDLKKKESTLREKRSLRSILIYGKVRPVKRKNSLSTRALRMP